MWKPIGPDGREYVGNSRVMSEAAIREACLEIAAWVESHRAEHDLCVNCEFYYFEASPDCPSAGAHQHDFS